jgi:glycine cleavage system pyridoxal-binding protein P
MLAFLGYDSIEGLMNDVVPESIRLNSSNMFNYNGKTLKGICSETLMLERIR